MKNFNSQNGAMEIGDWTGIQADQHLLPATHSDQGRAEALDMFSALYGLDARKADPGQYGGRSAQLLDEAQALPEWQSLQQKAEAKPWACAAAAKTILAKVSDPGHEEQKADEAEQEAREELEQAREDLEQAQQNEGDADADADSEGEGDADADADADSEGDAQGDAQGTGAGSEVAAAQQAVEAAQDALKAAEKAAHEAREQGKAYRAAAMAKAMEKAEENIENTEEAMRGLAPAQTAGTEQVLGTPVDDLAREISKRPELAKIMRWAGRMAMTGRAKARQRRGRGSNVQVDIQHGGIADICDALPAEMLGLVDPDLEILMDKSICEESIEIEKKRGRDPEERGPVVACVDESGSMLGARDSWAKAVAFAMFLRCVEENRPFAVVRFDHRNEVISFPKPRNADWSEVRRWLFGFRDGGTNIEQALFSANSFIENQKGFSKADVLLVTDGHGGKWHNIAEEMRKAGRSIYGVRISQEWDAQDVEFLEEAISVDDRQLQNAEQATKKLEGALAV